jgi:hypothetical protein
MPSQKEFLRQRMNQTLTKSSTSLCRRNGQRRSGVLRSAYIPLLARDGNPYGILRKTIRDVVLLPQSKVAKPLV